ncbi:MAG: S9 family peptidase [Halovenus sp.]
MSLDPESIYDLSTPTQVAVSPDGERVSFLADEFDPGEEQRRSSLFVVPTDGSRDPHRLTRASDASMPKWGPDGDRLAFVAARETDVAQAVGREDTEEEEAEDGDEEDEEGTGGKRDDDEPDPQVWSFDLSRGGDAVQLTDHDEGVREFDWAPDGERIVVSARDPTDEQKEHLDDREDGGPVEIERLQHKANGAGWLDDVRSYLFVVDVGTGERERLDDAYGQGAREPLFGLQPAWGPNGRIAFGSNRTERPDDSGVMHLYTIDPDGGNLRQLTDSEIQASAYRWSPDGDRLAFLESDPENWYKPTELCVASPGDGDSPVDYWSVTASLDRTVSLMGEPAWLGSDSLVVPVGDEGLTRLVRATATADDPVRTFSAQTRDRTLAAADVDGGTVAAVLSDPAAGPDVFTVAADELGADEPASLTQVSARNADLLADTGSACRRLVYENGDGEEIEAIVHLPPDFDPEADEPRPVIASIHGGPMSYDAPEFAFTYTYWVEQGYVVYRPNYRGSTSYGREFAESLMGTRGGLETDDVVSGLSALADRGWVDPDRSVVTGFSYGGITTANVVTRTDAFAAAAAEHGIYDFRSTFGTDDNHLWHEWEFGLPWDNEEVYAEISSITDVDQVDTPLLVAAGENDWRCPPTQAEQLYVSVRKQGVPAKLVIYQNEHHNVGDPDRAIHRIETLTDWFEEHARKGDDGGESGDEGDRSPD